MAAGTRLSMVCSGWHLPHSLETLFQSRHHLGVRASPLLLSSLLDLLVPTSNHPHRWQLHSFLFPLLRSFFLSPVLVCLTVNCEEATAQDFCILCKLTANGRLGFPVWGWEAAVVILIVSAMRSRTIWETGHACGDRLHQVS